MSSPSTTCPCGLGKDLDECCGPFVSGEASAPSPESLMRSRYTAFCMGTARAIEYLVESHHPDFRQPNLKAGLESTCLGITWKSLAILEAHAQGDQGTVEFAAIYEHDGEAHRLQERSSFQREDGKWLYTTGELDPDKNGPVTG